MLARPVQMIRQISNKMAAMRRLQDAGPQSHQGTPRGMSERPARLAGNGGRSAGPMPAAVKQAEPWRRPRVQKIRHIIRKRRERSPRIRRVVALISGVLLAILLLSASIGGYSAYSYYQMQLPKVQDLANLQIEQETRFYDREGNLIYTMYDSDFGRNIPITYNEIPGYVQDAQIAAEDKTFWSNNGVDPLAIVRSAFIDTSAGSNQTGASTLTQQVIKNLLITENNGKTPDRNYQEKITEAALAIGLTQYYSKPKIMEMYFNISSYGAQEIGIEAAAQDIFRLKPKCDAHFNCIPALDFLDRDNTDQGKQCKNPNDDSTCPEKPLLGLARATLLTSIPQNPVLYDPTVHYEYYSGLLKRQDYTLRQMKAAGMGINLGLGKQKSAAQANGQPIIITDDVIRQVEAMSRGFTFPDGFKAYNAAPHFIKWVIQNLANALGNGQDIDPKTRISIPGYHLLLTSGLNVQTTLDTPLQTYVEKAIKRHITQPEYQPFKSVYATLSKDNKLHDSAAVVMDAKTGEVLAMDGSVDYTDPSPAGAGQINMATDPRQPGSSFKPIIIAAAYEAGFYPGIVLPDIKTYFPNGGSQSLDSAYAPNDYGGKTNNVPSNIEWAISNSYNIPALKAEYYVGLDNVYNMATRLGITSIQPVRGVAGGLVNSMALGTDPVSLLEMVGAYQTFANYGTRLPAQGVLGIWDNYGHQLYQYNPRSAGARVLSPQISYLVTKTLDNEAERQEFAPDHELSMWDWDLPNGTHPDVAAKTGTTDSFRDNWTLGYTPDVVVGVWSGNANNDEMSRDTIGVTGATPIWHSIMEYVMGKCNKTLTSLSDPTYSYVFGVSTADSVSCPPLDLHYTDRQFTEPSGIVQRSVNTTNGLKGSGYVSYMLRNEVPQWSGLPTCTPASDGKNHGGNTPCTSSGQGG